MESTTEKLLGLISDWTGGYAGAFSIRENGSCAARRSTPHIQIEDKPDAPGLVVRVSPQAQDETVYIPACVTHGGVDDLVYNDFYIGDGARVTIVAGCGVHNDEEEEARHNGIHRFFVGKGAYVLYKEKHLPPARPTPRWLPGLVWSFMRACSPRPTRPPPPSSAWI